MAKKITKKKTVKSAAKKVKRAVKAASTALKKKASASRGAAKKKTIAVAKSKSTSKPKVKTSAKRVTATATRNLSGAKRNTTTAKMLKPSKSMKSLSATKVKATAGKATKRITKNDTMASLPPATAQDPIQFPEENKRVPKTKLSRKELNGYRKLLLAKRAELTGDVANLSFEVNNRNGVGGDHGNMPIHMADIGSDNWEHEFTLGLLANEHERIRQIDDALLRIADRTYGVCLATHKAISNARLTAKPWAKYCIDYARAREEGRAI